MVHPFPIFILFFLFLLLTLELFTMFQLASLTNHTDDWKQLNPARFLLVSSNSYQSIQNLLKFYSRRQSFVSIDEDYDQVRRKSKVESLRISSFTHAGKRERLPFLFEVIRENLDISSCFYHP